MPESYNPPTFKAEAFHCPHCNVYASQAWRTLGERVRRGRVYGGYDRSGIASCSHCCDISIWHNERMIYPSGGAAPPPNSDLPDDIKRDYEEARDIVILSPRGAAALLRLCVQKLCKVLGEPGYDINKDVGNLVKQGLLVHVQQSLDILRITGNAAVHPGKLDLKDDHAMALALFDLVNVIAENEISRPKQIAALYSKMPQTKLAGIKQRDGKL